MTKYIEQELTVEKTDSKNTGNIDLRTRWRTVKIYEVYVYSQGVYVFVLLCNVYLFFARFSQFSCAFNN